MAAPPPAIVTCLSPCPWKKNPFLLPLAVAPSGDAPETVRREELVLAPDADGRQRHVRKLDEKLVKREDLAPGPRPGKEMAVSGGRHEGLRCIVVEVLPKEGNRSGEGCMLG